MSNIDHVQKYRDCAARGLSQADTARELGVSREAVRLMANKHVIHFSRKSDVRRSFVAAAAEGGGLTRREIAEAIGLSLPRVSRLLPAGHQVPRQPLPAPRGEQIAALAAQGLTVTEVARRLGISQVSVSAAKKRHGIVFLRDGRARS
jgi:DNA-binding CsgD family transcriptional regulator